MLRFVLFLVLLQLFFKEDRISDPKKYFIIIVNPFDINDTIVVYKEFIIYKLGRVESLFIIFFLTFSDFVIFSNSCKIWYSALDIKVTLSWHSIIYGTYFDL